MSDYQFVIIKIKENTDIYSRFKQYIDTKDGFKYYNIFS